MQRVRSVYLEQDGRLRSSQPVREYPESFPLTYRCPSRSAIRWNMHREFLLFMARTILVKMTFRRVLVGDANSVYSHAESSHLILGNSSTAERRLSLLLTGFRSLEVAFHSQLIMFPANFLVRFYHPMVPDLEAESHIPQRVCPSG
jgi:hypothetical protein